MSYPVWRRHLWWAWGKQICSEIFQYFNPEAFFPAPALWLFPTHLLMLEEMKCHLWEVPVINIKCNPEKQEKPSPQPDSCPVPALLKQAENFLSQPFTEEITIFPCQQRRFCDCFPSLWLQSGTKTDLLYMGFLGASSEFEYPGCSL